MNQIMVKSITGKTRTIPIQPSTTIKEMKEMIYEKEGININEQRLIFAGKSLEDDRTAADYNINNGSTIHLALRMR